MYGQKTDLKNLLERYLQYCVCIRNYAPETIKSYREIFRYFVSSTKVVYLEELTKPLFEAWFFHGRLERKWTSATFRHYHKRFNAFFKWLVKESIVEKNILADIELPKMEQRLPKTLTKEESTLILDMSYHMKYPYKFEKFRNRAMLALMLLAGLRISEVVHLKLHDVSFESRTIFIHQGKGSKDRMIPMNMKLCSILEEYLKDRNRLKKSSIFFFTAVQKDLGITKRAITNNIKVIRERLKIPFSAHTLRHAFARLMLEGGCDIYTLSKLMGHARITTTTIYLSCSNMQMAKSVEMHSLNSILT
ncbi:MAG: tyrosine-type recombinase/integrase [Candidatus Gracilibacteria bacterium]